MPLASLILCDVVMINMFMHQHPFAGRCAHSVIIAALLVGIPACRTAPALVLDSFTYSSDEAAQKIWRASPGAPPVEVASREGGAVFPCRFSGKTSRVYWDRDVRADISKTTSIHLDIQCDDPSALRSPLLYFRSGKGWYAGRIPLRGSGRQTVFINRNEFTREGTPSGWHKIDGIRLSAWRADNKSTMLRLYAVRAEADPVVVVRNTLSSPSPAERQYGAGLAARISAWLTDLGVPHGVITDEQVIHGGLMNSRVAILTYHPHPPPREIATLKYFVRGGGRLIVCYGAEPALAELMGVELKSYMKATRPGQWASFIFKHPSYWNVPEQVFQNSPNIMAAQPASRRARTIANWYDIRGRPTDEAAWIASDNGFWMTHVLLADDAANKRDMLLGLVAALAPDVWLYAAQHAAQKVGQIDSFRNFAEACDEVSRAGMRHPDRAIVAGLLNEAIQEHARLLEAMSKRSYAEVISRARTVRRLLTEAYAEVQSPRPEEFRAVWDHSGTGWFPGDWNRTCGVLADSGINTLFVNTMWAGLAHYPSKVLPISATAQTLGDQMAQCIEAARRHHLAVHVWYVCWNIENAPADFVAEMKKQHRLQQSKTGHTALWLCPSHPANVELALAALREVTAGYPIAGVHLDYIRYPSAEYCYCPNCRAAFEKATRHKVRNWPRDVLPKGRYHEAFVQWRADQITRFVQRARETVKGVRSSVYISAAVWGAYPNTIANIGQDWGLWLKQNLVDFVCPMNYTADNTRFAEWVRGQLALPNAARRVYPGIGVTARESQLAPDQVIEQILLLRGLGAQGFALFDLSQTLRNETLPLLRRGVTSR